MKKLATLTGLAIILAAAVMLWGQYQPDNTNPASPFLARINYHDCNCSINDRVDFINQVGTDYRYAVRCGPTEDSVLTTKLQSGWYYIRVYVPTFNGCDSTVALNHIWHSGFDTQYVNLDVYP